MTILVPVYNAKSTIKAGLNSILAMARAQDEVLIIDDGSVDNSLAELKKYSNMDSRINLISCRHKGLVEVLNFGMRVSANELIARADIDDTYQPNRLLVQVTAISRSREISAVFSDYKVLSVKGANLGVIPSACTYDLTKLSLINHHRTPHPSVLFRKESVIAAGGYINEDFPAEDYALWSRLSIFSKICSVPQVLLNYTLNPNGISSTRTAEMKKKNLMLQLEVKKNLDVEMYRNSLSVELSKLDEVGLAAERKLLTIRDYIKLLALNEYGWQKISKEVLHQVKALDLKPNVGALIKLDLQRRRRAWDRH